MNPPSPREPLPLTESLDSVAVLVEGKEDNTPRPGRTLHPRPTLPPVTGPLTAEQSAGTPVIVEGKEDNVPRRRPGKK
jgi:hypothetical protein